MLSAQTFFDLSTYRHTELIRPDEEAWSGLKKLKTYLAAQPYPDLSPDLIQDGVPLRRTLVYYNGTLLESREFDIQYGDATKGMLKVYNAGQQLIGASLIMAGAVFCGRQIHLGLGHKAGRRLAGALGCEFPGTAVSRGFSHIAHVLARAPSPIGPVEYQS